MTDEHEEVFMKCFEDDKEIFELVIREIKNVRELKIHSYDTKRNCKTLYRERAGTAQQVFWQPR